MSLLVGISSGKYNNQNVPKPMVLVKAVVKVRINNQRVDFLIHLISLVDIMKVPLAERAMDMVTPHLSRKQN